MAEKSKAKMGRPKKEFSPQNFQKLCALQPTLDEAASFFSLSDETLQARCKEHFGCTFLDALKRFAGTGKISLRRAQWKAALGGNPALLIWLGKQYLNQSEKIDHDMSKPIIVKIDSDDAKL